MGVHREFNFDDDIELLNLKYQMSTGNFSEYFQNNIEKEEEGNINTNKITNLRNQL